MPKQLLLGRFLLLSVAVLVTSSYGFTSPTSPTLRTSNVVIPRSPTSTTIFANNNNNNIDKDKLSPLGKAYDYAISGEKNFFSDPQNRGIVLLTVVVSACLWFFTIPPHFRRQNICQSLEQYEQLQFLNPHQNDNYEGCITREMWNDSIVEYYKNGGGIEIDFSVDPRTVAKNKAAVESFFSGSK